MRCPNPKYRRVVVTGVGVVSPVGIGKTDYWRSLLSGRSGVGNIKVFDATAYPTQVAGEICGFDPSDFLTHKEARRIDRSSQMILAASGLALEDSGIVLGQKCADTVGVFAGTAVGGQGWAFREYEVFREKGLARINPFTAISTFPNAASTQISSKFGLTGPSVTISTGCVSSTLALGYAFDNIRLGRIDVAFVGGTEAPLEPGIFGAYCAARVMTTQNEVPSQVPRPFDLRRDGIVLSEGAGVLICEALDHATQRGARVYAEVRGWAHNADSSHMTMINPDGIQAQSVVQKAISEAGLGLADIDAVLAHAAGTRADDKTEANVLRAVFGPAIQRIPVTSLKSMLGHTQGACGSIEGAGAVLAIANSVLPPTINCDEIDRECEIEVVRGSALAKPLRSILMNTFGFGGKNVSVVLSVPDLMQADRPSELIEGQRI